jgi:long-chain acyl-CoA synthetase
MIGPGDLQYFWLPLAHVFGKVLEAAQIRIGFPTAVDGRVERLVANLKLVRPTFVCAVPRIFEKARRKVLAQAQEAGGVKHKLFLWAFGIGRKVSKLRQAGREPRGLLALCAAAADAFVFRKVRATFGGRLRFFISGSAPLARDLAEFFHAFGILILEGYGLTESSAVAFVNRPTAYRFGSVGLAVPGTEVRIAQDGEILLRGRGIMRCYHNRPESAVDELNARLPRHETIKRFALLPVDFSVESGELTPSLKPRRRFIEQKYAAVLTSFYGVDGPGALN